MDQAKKDKIRKGVIYTAGAITGIITLSVTGALIWEYFDRRDPEYRAWAEHAEKVRPLIEQIEDAFDDFKSYNQIFDLEGNQVSIESHDIEVHGDSIDSLIVTIRPRAASQEDYRIIDLRLNGLSDKDMIENGQSYKLKDLSIDEQQKVRQVYERILRHPKVLNIREYLQEEQTRREEAQRINEDKLRKARENKIDSFYRKFR